MRNPLKRLPALLLALGLGTFLMAVDCREAPDDDDTTVPEGPDQPEAGTPDTKPAPQPQPVP